VIYPWSPGPSHWDSAAPAWATKAAISRTQPSAAWVREDGAGLSSRSASGGEPQAGWEDSAVATQNLAAYLSDFRELLDENGIPKSVLASDYGTSRETVYQYLRQAKPEYALPADPAADANNSQASLTESPLSASQARE
jgi:hypothetical protein